MKKLNFIIALLVTSALTISISSCAGDEAEAKVEKKENLINVSTTKLVSSEFTDYLSVVGSVKPYNKSMLSFQEGGIVKKFNKDKGDFVKEGDIIAVIDNDILKAGLDASEAQYELAKINYEKQKTIYADKVNSEFQYLQSKYNLAQAKANYELNKARYERTFITAPFSGVIDDKYYEVGELAPPGMPIVHLISANNLEIHAGIPERFAGKVKRGSEAKIQFSDITDEIVSGKVDFVGPSIDPKNRTFQVEIKINSKNEALKPELVAEVKLNLGNYENIILIPDEVVTRMDDSYMVYVVENGVAVSKPIEIISRMGTRVAVSSGLNAGDELIVLGFQNLVSGQKVNIIN